MTPSDSDIPGGANTGASQPAMPAHHQRFLERAAAVPTQSQSINVTAPDAEGFVRLHPTSLVFRLARLARNLLLPMIVVIFLSRKGAWEQWLGIIFIPAALIEGYRYLMMRYRIDAEALVIRQGLLFRRERQIPLARVQNIDVVQNPFHRMLKVAEIRIETAGGSEPEAVFRVLSIDAIERIRARVFAERSAAAEPTTGQAGVAVQTLESAWSATQQRQLHSIGLWELVKLGLISNRGAALIFIVLGVAWEYDIIDRVGWKTIVDFVSQHIHFAGWMQIAALALAALLLLRALSVAWVVLRFYDYQLARAGEDLRITCGLFTRVTATVPRRRIQVVSVQQTLFQQWIGRASIRIETAGGGGGGGTDSDSEKDVHSTISRRWFVPTIPIDQVPMILRELRESLPIEFQQACWQRLAPRARWRMMFKSLRVALVIVVAIAAIFRPWGFLSLLLIVPLALWHAHRTVAFLSCAPTPGGFLVRSGAWTRRISATFFDKMQIITLTQSPFDRRWRMATVAVDTAGAGPAEHAMRVPYLRASDARELVRHLAAHAEQTEFKW